VDVTITSDESLKTNWRSFGSGLIDRLSGVKRGIYDRTDSSLTQVGVAAQSLEQVLPEAVFRNADGKLQISQSATLALVLELAAEVVRLRGLITQGAH
jgi:hypothetical protein